MRMTVWRRVLLLRKTARFSSAAASHQQQKRGFSPLVAGVAGGITVSALATPFLPETRKGLLLAWRYPSEIVDERGTASETAWRLGVGTLSGIGASWAVVRGITSAASSNPLTGIPKALVATFSGFVTFSVVTQIAPDYVIPVARRTTRLVLYTVDGLAADVKGGRDDANLAPLWERRDGITPEDVEKWMEREELRKEALKQTSQESNKNFVKLENLSVEELEARIKEMKDQKSSSTRYKEALRVHRTLLVSSLLKHRRDQELVQAQLSSKKEASEKLQDITKHDYLGDEIQALEERIRSLDEEKKKLKEKAWEFHDSSLNSLCDAEVYVLVHRLEELRERQLMMARQAQEAGKFDSMVIKRQLQALDIEKGDLKKKTRETFGVNISNRAKAVTPWRTVF